MGFSPGKNRRAMVSLTIATQSAVAVSRSVKSRPRSMGIFMVAKKFGVTGKKSAVRSSAFATFRPWMVNVIG